MPDLDATRPSESLLPAPSPAFACNCDPGEAPTPGTHSEDCPAGLLIALEAEIARQDSKHGPYEGTRLGRSRLALATLEDETKEALQAWRDERGALWHATRAEVLQVAAVAFRTLRDAL